MHKDQAGTREGEPIFDRLIWQPCLALLSCFSCPDNERPDFRSQQLVVAFPAKVNLLALTIFKQRLPISEWFYNSALDIFFWQQENEMTVRLMNG